jgi:magnesium-protoporphyrin IX monomethyl ester (oxidative) cyclase
VYFITAEPAVHPQEYNNHIIRKTNETSARAFAMILNTEHPDFFPLLDKCSEYNLKLVEINNSDYPKIMK